LLNETGRASVLSTAVRQQYDVVVRIAPLLALVGLLAVTVVAVVQNDLVGLVRRTTLYLPVAVVGTLLAPQLAALILRLADALSGAVSSGAASNFDHLATFMSKTPAVPAFGIFLLQLISVVAAVVLWIELIVRNVVLCLLLCCVPLVAAASTWAPARRLTLRLIESYVAVALSKVVVVLALSLGLSTLTHANGTTTLLTAAATLAMASLTPFVVLRLIPLVEHSALHAVDGLRQRAVRTAFGASSHPVVQTLTNLAPTNEPPLPEPGPDLGLSEWPGEPNAPDLPDFDGPRPSSPIEPPTVRKGHVVIGHDRLGPVIGWEWDD
jgi:hypothetical protein